MNIAQYVKDQKWDRLLQEKEEKIQELERALAYLQEKAYIDSLTGLYNKSALEEDLHEEGTHLRFGGFVDIDDLKMWNSKVGHMHANYIIERIAQEMKSCLRNVDKAYRFGGDELFFILDYTPKAGQREDDIYRQVNAIQQRIERLLASGVTVTLPDGKTVIATATTGDLFPIKEGEAEHAMHLASINMLDKKTKKKTILRRAL